jgi:hypothetical protein
VEPSEKSTIHEVDELVGNPVIAMDEAVLARLRDAIAAEDVDEEEQLKGVLRMLGEEILEQNQLHLFNGRPGR